MVGKDINLRILHVMSSDTSPKSGMDNFPNNYKIKPVLDTNGSQVNGVLQLEFKYISAKIIRPFTATIGCVVEVSGKTLYLAPAQFFVALCDPSRWIEREKERERAQLEEEEDAYFGVFEDETDSGGEPDSLDANSNIHKIVKQETLPSFVYTDDQNVFKSLDFNYCLIEVSDELSSDKLLTSCLPILSDEAVGFIDREPASVNVKAVTSSGNTLTGVLSGGLFIARLSYAIRYVEVRSAQFEQSPQEGDTGSIIRDAETNVIYGYMVAFYPNQRIGLFIPASDLLKDVMKQSIR